MKGPDDDVSHSGDHVLYSRICRDLSSSSRLVGATSGGRKSTNLWSPVRRRAPKILINNRLHSVPEKTRLCATDTMQK